MNYAEITNAGEAYLFKASTGELVYTFSNPSPAVNDYFGYKFDIEGDRISNAFPDALHLGHLWPHDVVGDILEHRFSIVTFDREDLTENRLQAGRLALGWCAFLLGVFLKGINLILNEVRGGDNLL